jgi:alanine racemase
MDAKQSLGEPRLLISRSALLHNARLIRRAVGPDVRLCAILKADAYGHGAEIVADTLCIFGSGRDENPAVDAVAVASIDEAASLPALPVPVIVFRPVENAFVGRQRAKIEAAVREGWTLTLCSGAGADDVARIAQGAGSRANVQVMIDTGMTRAGVPLERLDDLLRKIDGRPSLRLAGLCTHFATAEIAGDPFVTEQLARFRAATDTYVASKEPRLRPTRHAANSGAIFFAPESHLDMVRPGLSLYGIDPAGRPRTDRPLRPAMRWTAPLLSIRDVRPGTTVGYGQTWTAKRPTRVGLVPVGYADGYPRCFSNKAVMLVNGRPAPVVGRVSMDLTTIDLERHPHATVGDEVTVLDSDPLSPASAYRLAEWMDTLPYEIFCRIGPRIHRVPVEPDEPGDPRRLVEADEVG